MEKCILYTNENGGLSIVMPAPGVDMDVALRSVPTGIHYEIVDADKIPTDRTFRNAWFHDTTPEPQKVGVDVDKAKIIAHEVRREKRAEEFKPLDVQATIPMFAAQAEESRQAVRSKYESIQAEIDSTDDVEQLATIIKGL